MTIAWLKPLERAAGQSLHRPSHGVLPGQRRRLIVCVSEPSGPDPDELKRRRPRMFSLPGIDLSSSRIDQGRAHAARHTETRSRSADHTD
jgi:hypothetical protein